ncbi:glycosyltransferase involved in cell wall biosynthesis [Maribacter vaceletii]|uniref:Glycosyltransferase involved in cell wall biosynthesis n=1 Tax=Maribacter vaceletii TaxID=1206816 RepID=A0A495EDQ9_9FLAO|nr:glycosyltransferase family 1 protein [Maribacter vaceletii]RKR14769.1 glycosyltransferase involved in cell wall biosynthesis [Maribacter vaceletii]
MIIVNARFLTQKITGVQRFGIEISKELKRLNPDIIFVSPKNIIHVDVAKELNVKCIGPFSGHAWEQITLQKYVISKNALLISLCNTAPLFIKNQVVTIHDLCFKVHPEWFSKSFYTFYNFLIPRIVKKALFVLTVSETSKNEIIEILGVHENKISVIYNAVAPFFLSNEFHENVKNKLLNKKYILTVSSHHPRKNFKSLIDAFNLINDPNLNLYIIGNVNKHFIQNYIKKDNTRVKFLSNILDADLVEFYKRATLFVYPSLYEGFGIPIIEALSQQTTVVVSDIPVFREVCENHDVFFFNPYSINDIKNNILLGLKNLNKNKIKQEDLSLKYSWEKSAKKVLKIINENI